jgi:hypothetical protein
MKMIVTHSGANVVYLPVQHFIKEGKDAGKLKAGVDQSKVHRFNPGANEVDLETWKLVQDGIAARDVLRPGVKEHYDAIFCVIGGEEQEDGLMVGPDEIDFLDLHWQQAVNLVEGTVIMEKLEEYQAIESGNDKPRNSVLKAIEKQMNEVKTFHKKIADDKESK